MTINHNPNITSSAATGSFSEDANTTGSSALHSLSGTMNFTDSDRSDTHTTTASLKTAVLSSGTIIPSTTLAHLNAAMASSILSDSNGSGKLKWSFNAEDDDFDFLSKNQSLTVTYEIKLKDNHGGSTTKTVTITVTGTDDKPLIDFGTEAVVNEQANKTLSLSPDVAHVAIHFTDPDLTNTGHTAQVTGVSASGATDGLLPGVLGELELMAFFHVDSVVKASGSSDGTINATFAAPDLAFDYLSDGETVDITYTIKLNDNAGGITTQTVVVTVVGSNDKPVFLCGPDSANLVEGENVSPAGDLTAHGDLLFTDIDLSDTHLASATVVATRSGGGAVPISNADLLAALSLPVDDSTGHLLGDVDWSFALSNSSVAFLNSGETLTLQYTVTIDDGNGGTDTQLVTITILGTNDPVVVTSGPQSASLAEFADTTGSAVLNTTSPVPTGTIAFTDTDLGDAHTVAVTVDAAVWSGGPAIPSGTDADLPTALLTTLNDSTGTGAGGVDWTFSIADQDLDFLAFGETLTVTYNVAISDGPTSSSQTVTVTIDGANDAVAVTSGPQSSSVAEQPNQTGSSSPDSTSPVPTGTLTFSDVDLNDTHSVTVTLDSAVWSVDPFFVPSQTAIDLQTALSTTLNDSTVTGTGGVDWSFSIPDKDLDFLSDGETLTITYLVTVSDGFTSSTQTVTITATGAHDDLVASDVTGTLFDTILVDTGSSGAFGNILFEGTTGSDTSTTVTLTEINGSAANIGTPIAGLYGTLFVDSNGNYSYIANAAVDPLQDGDTVTDHFTFTVEDSTSQTATASLDINVVGTDDAPQITAASAFGSITEDAGPSATVNGDFEDGTLTGWFATPGVTVEFLASGGAFGNYSARLPGSGSLEQDVATTAGQHYTLSFYVAGDGDASSTSFTAYWDGVPILSLSSVPFGFNHYTFDVVGDALDPTTQFFVDYSTDGTGMYFDALSVSPTPGPATETTGGSISFSDVESADTHTASFTPNGSDYVGTFTLDPVSESGGSGSVGWSFTVSNADIQFLAQDQTVNQTYTVLVTDDHGVSTAQLVTVSLNGSNDAPSGVDDTLISNAGADGATFAPGWALAANDTDPDTIDTVAVNSVTGATGGSAFLFGAPIFQDDATLGGSFNYDVVDNHGAVSSGSATVNVTNLAASTTTLVGTAGDDIVVALNDGDTLQGGGGNDILIGIGNTHTMTGGSGDDIFAVQVVPGSPLTITDFDNITSQDQVAINSAAFGGLTPGQDPSTVFESSDDDQFIFANFHYDNSNQTLYYSFDGTTASAIAIATFQPGVLLHANDLMIV